MAVAAPTPKVRAVVLVPGLYVHPLHPSKVMVPERRNWQEPKSELVKALAPDSDVFAFGYSQAVTLDDVALSAGLLDAVTRLRKLGYTQIVLIGHSAGGVIVRQFAERRPGAGVTKVIAVAAPFAGAEAATFKVGYPKVQKAFVHSLAPEVRTEAVRTNPFPISAELEFACVVCKLKHAKSDGLVGINSQWPEELQKLGVPSVLATVSHFDVMHSASAAKTIAELVRGKVVRWSPEQTEQARKKIHSEQVSEKHEGSMPSSK
jgi:pimeloyl-ACP methyl ester carboxylesterase